MHEWLQMKNLFYLKTRKDSKWCFMSAIKDVMLTQVDSWQCQWMPDYPQIGHQKSSCIKTKQDYDYLIYIKVTTGNKTFK